MKRLVILAVLIGLPCGAQAQSPGAVNGLGFVPPASVASFNNLGGQLGGVGTGVNTFTINPVKTLPLFHNNAALGNLQAGANFIIGQARPAP